MRLVTLIAPAIASLTLSAQEDIHLRLAKAHGVGLEEIQNLRAQLAAASATPEQKAYHEAYLGYCTVNILRDKNPTHGFVNYAASRIQESRAKK